MVLLELFSGIGGFAKGFEQAGYKFTKHYFSEIDKHAIANYKFNFPNAESLGSVTDISGSQIQRPDIITFGFPCQDLSIAGKRKGFAGKRSSLFYEAMRIIKETEVPVFIWENVAGLLSSRKGKDFEAVCETMSGAGYLYSFDFVNTKLVLPQNRLRIYCVGRNIKWLAQEVLKNGANKRMNLFGEILRGYLLSKSVQNLGELSDLSDIESIGLVLKYAIEKSCLSNGQKRKSKYLEIMLGLSSKQLQNLSHVIQLELSNPKDENLVLFIKELHDLQEEVTGYTMSKEKTEGLFIFQNIKKIWNSLSEEQLQEVNRFIILTMINRTTTLKTYTYAEIEVITWLFTDKLKVLYPDLWKSELSNLINQMENTKYAGNRRSKNQRDEENHSSQLPFSYGTDKQSITEGHLRGISKPRVFPITENDFISTKTNRAKQPQSQTQHSNTLRGKTMRADDTYILQDRRATNEIREYQDSSPTISSTWGMGGGNVPYVVQCNDNKESNGVQPYQQNRVYDVNGQMPALNSFSGRVGVRKEDSIRRLTEIECERLQGFPDDWTKFGNYDGEIKEITKGHRYRMLGNAVTVDIVQLIAERLWI